MRLRRTRPQRTLPREATRRRAINRLEALEARHLLDGSPIVTAYEPSGTVHETVSNIRLTLSDPVLDAGARDAANYELLHLGADRLVGGGDDQAFRVLPQYVTGATEIGLSSAVDLSRWSEVDYSFPGGLFGEWRVDGDSVVQDINGAMSFFVSDFDLVNSRFEGRLQVVDAGGDDDIIGFVFGFQQHAETHLPDQYYLVSWKQSSQGGAEAGLKLAKVTGTGGSLQRPDLWNLESSDPFIDVLAVGPSTGWQDGVAYDFAVDYASDGQIAITIRRADGGEVVWSEEFDDPAPLGPGRVGFYNYSQANVRYQPLSSGDALPDGYYQLTVNAGENGLQGLDGSPLDGDGDGNGGDDFVGTFAIETGFPQVSVELAPASDSGIAGDNLTRFREVSLDVTVNKIGRVDFDFNGDQVPDESRFLTKPQTFPVTRRFDSDGLHFVTATFTPASGGVTQTIAAVTVDTLPPRLLPGAVEVEAAWSEYTVTFDKPVIAASLSGNVALFDTAGAPIEFAIVEIDENEYLLRFAPQLIAGNYRLVVGPNIADLAGNLMPESTERIVTVDSDDFGPVVTGVAIQANSIVVDYLDQGGINPRWATAHSNYALLASGGDGAMGDDNDIDVSDRITQITFDPVTGRTVLVMDSPLADELYQLTINGDAPNGVQDLAGNLLEGGDYVADLPLNTAAATISLDLIPESDSNVATDNVTNDTTPTFEIAFNKAGLLELDFQNDGIIDERVLYTEPAAVRFTAPLLADRIYPALARFTPAVGGQVTAGLSYAIDTLPPQVAPDSAVVSSPWSKFTILFDGDVLGTFDAADVRLFGPQGEILGVAVSRGGGNTYELTFATQTAGGDYYFEIGPLISDVAGNVMSTAERVDIRFVPDVTGPSVVSFTPLGARNTNVTVLELTFSEPVTDFDVDDVVILGPDGRVELPDDALEPTGERTYRVHVPELSDEGTYAVTIGPDVRDLSGNRMSVAYHATFSIDKTGPRVIGVSPSGTIESPLTTIDVSFDQRIGNAPLDAFSLVGPNGVVRIIGVNEITDRDIRLTVDTTSANGEYTLTVGPGITDELGNPMAAPSDHHVQIALPDLQVGSFADLRRFGLPAAANFGESLRPLWYGINSGDANTRGSWTVRVWLSRDDVLVKSGNNADLALGEVAGSSRALIPGEPYTNQLAVNLPLAEGLASGEYRLIIEEDAHSNLLEANEQNNYLASDAITITRPTLPDVQVEQVTASEFALPGGSTTVEYALRSLGRDLLAGEGGFVDFYFSRDAAADTPDDDRFMDSKSFTGPLGAESISGSVALSIPTTGVSGPYFFLARLRTDVIESDSVNNVAISDTAVDVLGALSVTVNELQLREDAANPATRGLVTRNGDLTRSLVVTLVSSDPTELTVPSQVVIPAGQSAAAFEITVHPDATPDGNQLVTISAAAAELAADAAIVTVLDVDLPRLFLSTDMLEIVEGTTVSMTLTREFASPDAITVLLSANIAGQLNFPPTVTIPADALEATFDLNALDDLRIEAAQGVIVEARGGAYRTGGITLNVRDNDAPQLSLSFDKPSISEGAGARAALGTITRVPVSNAAVVVVLIVQEGSPVVAPRTVTIPAGQASATFYLDALDDVLVDGTQNAKVVARVRETGSTRTLEVGAASATIAVTDDDGPALFLSIDRDLANEGVIGAAQVTITRNTPPESDLVVSLASSDESELTVPTNVVIPAGQTSVTVAVDTLDDGAVDGNQFVSITVAAAGYAAASDSIIVSDADLADLVPTPPTGPERVSTDVFFSLSYRIDNPGFSSAIASNADGEFPGSWVDRVFLSPDNTIGDDILVGSFTFQGTLPVGLFYAREITARAPRAAGDYWIVVVTDVSEQVGEGVETNNARISEQPVHVLPAYTARVQTAVDVGIAGERVLLTGTATMAAGGPAIASIVNVHVGFQGTTRVVSALTNFAGQFQVSLETFPGQGGLYTVGAAHPGEASAPVQDQFTLLGLDAALDQTSRQVLEGDSFAGVIAVTNDTNVAMGGVQATIVSQTANLQVSFEYPSGDFLPGNGSLPIRYTVTAADASVRSGRIVFRITTTAGATSEVALNVTVSPLAPQLAASTGLLQAAMLRGSQRTVEFEITNAGSAPTGIVNVEVPNVPWLTVATTAQIPSLEPGESTSVTLLLTPAADLPLTAYNGNIVLRAVSGAYLSLPFTFRAVSDAQGDLVVTVVDELFYYTPEAPKVLNATVTLRDVLTGESITTTVVDGAGDYLLNDIREGYYALEVQATDHESYSATVFIAGGAPNVQLVFISQETVKYVWTVTETEIEDRTNITIESVFETNVPTPVVVIENPLIDLAPLEFVGDFIQVDMKITNHGLIAAQGLKLNFGTHPYYSFEPLISDIGVLPAKSSLTVPVIVRRVADETTGGGGGGGGSVPCDIGAWLEWFFLCGPHKVSKATGIPIINVDADCGGYTPSGGGGIPGGSPTEPSGPGGVTPIIVQATDPIDCSICVETKYKLSISSGGLFGSIVNQATAALEWIPYLEKLDVALNGSLEFIHCCKDGEYNGWKAKGSGEIQVAADFKYPLDGGTITTEGEWDGYSVSVEMGVEAVLAGKFKVAGGLRGETDCGLTNVRGCVTVYASGEAFVGLAGIAQVTLTKGEEKIKVGGKAKLGLQSELKGGAEFCLDGSHGFIRWSGVELIGSIEFAYNDQKGSISVSYVLVPPIEKRWPANVTTTQSQEKQSDFIWHVFAFALDQSIQTAQIHGRQWSASELTRRANGALDQRLASHRQAIGAAPDAGVCARVRLQINQEAVMTRTAFEAQLELTNSFDDLALMGIAVHIEVFDELDNIVTDLFSIRPPALVNLNAVDGTGILGPDSTGSANWLIIPTDQAAPIEPRVYRVGGALVYRQGELELAIPLEPIAITVRPDAALSLKYFHQRDVFSDDPHTDPVVEPAIPYTLAVMVENSGAGVAKNLKITSAQPQIIENEKGLLIDFQIIATEVFSALGFSQLTPSLIANFGDIAPDEIKIARWLLTSTLQGQFIDYKATFEHIDGLGDPRLSLIKSVKVLEMIRQVYAPDDALPDFLTNEVPDAPEDLPDTIHLSDGTVHSVALAGAASFDATAPSVADPVVELTVDMAAGWSYLRTHDIGDGKWRLTRVVRSDGTEIDPDNFWQTDRTFIEQGQRPRLENNLHLVDRDSTGRYTLYYTPLDTSPPSVESLQEVSPNPRNEAVASIDVLFTEDLASFDVTALRLTRDGGTNLIGAGVTITAVEPSRSHFRIAGLEGLTSDDGEYRLTVDASLVRDQFGNPGFGAESVEWVNGSLAVAAESIVGPADSLINTPLDGVQVLFTRTIDFATLDASDLRLTRNGVDLPVAGLSFSQTTERGYSIAGLADETSLDGDYQFCVNARTVADASGRAGVGGKCVSWTLDGTAPQVASIEEVAAERVPDGLGAIDVTFSEPIRAATFDWHDLVLSADGAPILLDAPVSVTPLAANRYRIRGLAAFSSDAADYTLQVNAADVQDFAANAGVGRLSADFDRLPAAPPAGITLSPATLIGADAWQAHSIALVLSGQLSEPGLTVSVFDVTTNQELGVPTLSGMSFLLPIRLEVSGQHALRVRASDAAGNAAQTTIQVFVRIITVGDLNNVRNDFGTTGENLPADFDRNGVIDIQDLNFVRNNLGSADSTPLPATMPRRRVASNAWDEALLETQAGAATPTTKHNAMDWGLDVLASSFEDLVALDELQLERGSTRADAFDAALLSFGEVESANLRVAGTSRGANRPSKALAKGK